MQYCMTAHIDESCHGKSYLAQGDSYVTQGHFITYFDRNPFLLTFLTTIVMHMYNKLCTIIYHVRKNRKL